MSSLRGSAYWFKHGAIACGVGACFAGAPALAESEVASTQAAWQSYDINFPYMSHTTFYSCTGLEDRLEQILKELGARSDVRVAALGCFNDVSNMLTARIRVSMPVAAGSATPEGETPFAAKPATVTLKSRTLGQTGSGDCELLEQMRDRLLPKLKLQVVEDDLVCVPGQASSGTHTLQVTALLPEKEP